jgi:hypothetical protein
MNVPTQVIVHSVVQNPAVTKHLQQVMVGRPMFVLILGRSPISALRKHVAKASRHQVISRSMFAHIQVHELCGCEPESHFTAFLYFCGLNVRRQAGTFYQ